MREKRYSQLFRGRRRSIAPRICLIAFLSLFVVACSNNLEEKLTLIEQRVLDETAFGKQMRDYMKSKNTPYILDESLPFQARYAIVDDSIHYNPKLNSSLNLWKEKLLLGRPIRTILKFHENLHRTQVGYSERGAFCSFFWENGKIEEDLLKNGRSRYRFKLDVQDGDEGKLFRFAGSLAGRPVMSIDEASNIVKDKMDEMNATNKEKILLDEIQAYLGSDIVTAEDVYSQLYEKNKRGYESLPKMSFDDFSRLCDLIIELYGFYEGNHDEVCQVVGKSKSIKDFHKRVQSVLGDFSPNELKKRVDNWRLLKHEWTKETQRIAQKVLK